MVHLLGGRMSTVYQRYVTVLLGGTSVNGMKSRTSIPSVLPNPWNKHPNLFSSYLVQHCRIAGLGCLLRYMHVPNVLSSSSHIDPPAMATCCTMSACAAQLYLPMYVALLCILWCCIKVGVWLGSRRRALFGVGIYNA